MIFVALLGKLFQPLAVFEFVKFFTWIFKIIYNTISSGIGIVKKYASKIGIFIKGILGRSDKVFDVIQKSTESITDSLTIGELDKKHTPKVWVWRILYNVRLHFVNRLLQLIPLITKAVPKILNAIIENITLILGSLVFFVVVYTLSIVLLKGEENPIDFIYIVDAFLQVIVVIINVFTGLINGVIWFINTFGDLLGAFLGAAFKLVFVAVGAIISIFREQIAGPASGDVNWIGHQGARTLLETHEVHVQRIDSVEREVAFVTNFIASFIDLILTIILVVVELAMPFLITLANFVLSRIRIIVSFTLCSLFSGDPTLIFCGVLELFAFFILRSIELIIGLIIQFINALPIPFLADIRPFRITFLISLMTCQPSTFNGLSFQGCNVPGDANMCASVNGGLFTNLAGSCGFNVRSDLSRIEVARSRIPEDPFGTVRRLEEIYHCPRESRTCPKALSLIINDSPLHEEGSLIACHNACIHGGKEGGGWLFRKCPDDVHARLMSRCNETTGEPMDEHIKVNYDEIINGGHQLFKYRSNIGRRLLESKRFHEEIEKRENREKLENHENRENVKSDVNIKVLHDNIIMRSQLSPHLCQVNDDLGLDTVSIATNIACLVNITLSGDPRIKTKHAKPAKPTKPTKPTKHHDINTAPRDTTHSTFFIRASRVLQESVVNFNVNIDSDESTYSRLHHISSAMTFVRRELITVHKNWHNDETSNHPINNEYMHEGATGLILNGLTTKYFDYQRYSLRRNLNEVVREQENLNEVRMYQTSKYVEIDDPERHVFNIAEDNRCTATCPNTDFCVVSRSKLNLCPKKEYYTPLQFVLEALLEFENALNSYDFFFLFDGASECWSSYNANNYPYSYINLNSISGGSGNRGGRGGDNNNEENGQIEYCFPLNLLRGSSYLEYTKLSLVDILNDSCEIDGLEITSLEQKNENIYNCVCPSYTENDHLFQYELPFNNFIPKYIKTRVYYAFKTVILIIQSSYGDSSVTDSIVCVLLHAGSLLWTIVSTMFILIIFKMVNIWLNLIFPVVKTCIILSLTWCISKKIENDIDNNDNSDKYYKGYGGKDRDLDL